MMTMLRWYYHAGGAGYFAGDEEIYGDLAERRFISDLGPAKTCTQEELNALLHTMTEEVELDGSLG